MIKTISIIVKGRVQGVGFRHFTVLAANEYQIKGFVRNEPDGSVYIEAEGEDELLNEFIDFCKKGPAWARVDKIFVKDIPLAQFTEFLAK